MIQDIPMAQQKHGLSRFKQQKNYQMRLIFALVRHCKLFLKRSFLLHALEITTPKSLFSTPLDQIMRDESWPHLPAAQINTTYDLLSQTMCKIQYHYSLKWFRCSQLTAWNGLDVCTFSVGLPPNPASILHVSKNIKGKERQNNF